MLEHFWHFKIRSKLIAVNVVIVLFISSLGTNTPISVYSKTYGSWKTASKDLSGSPALWKDQACTTSRTLITNGDRGLLCRICLTFTIIDLQASPEKWHYEAAVPLAPHNTTIFELEWLWTLVVWFQRCKSLALNVIHSFDVAARWIDL